LYFDTPDVPHPGSTGPSKKPGGHSQTAAELMAAGTGLWKESNHRKSDAANPESKIKQFCSSFIFELNIYQRDRFVISKSD